MHIQSVTTHYHALQSDVPDENGEHMQLDTSVHPPRIIHLHLTLDNWDGDEIIESFPVYVVTDRLGKALSNAGLSSFTLRNAEITLAPEEQAVLDRHGISELPNFQWLDVTGTAGRDALGITDRVQLVVSDSALAVLQQFRMEHCLVEEYDG